MLVKAHNFDKQFSVDLKNMIDQSKKDERENKKDKD